MTFGRTSPPFHACSTEYHRGTLPPEELLVVEEQQFAHHVDAVETKQPWQSMGICDSEQGDHLESCEF